VAAALGVDLALHPEARELIALRIAETANGDPVKADLNQPENQHRFKMGSFRSVLGSFRTATTAFRVSRWPITISCRASRSWRGR
jgi:hypothetical protein